MIIYMKKEKKSSTFVDDFFFCFPRNDKFLSEDKV